MLMLSWILLSHSSHKHFEELFISLMKRMNSKQDLKSIQINNTEGSVSVGDSDIRRSNTMPPMKLQQDDQLMVKVLESASKAVSLRRRNTTKVEYPTSNYYESDSIRPATPGFTNVPLTAVNVLLTPDSGSQISSPKTPVFENVTLESANKVITLVRPNLARAFGRKALSYQKRQRFQNLCCVLFCPFSMVMVSLFLKIIVSSLSADDSTTDFGNNY